MRTYTTGTTTIKYPDAVLQVFNPHYIEIASALTGTITIDVSDGTNGKSINCKLYSGKAKIYISRLMQLFFKKEYYKALTIMVKNGTTPVLSFNVKALWGVQKIEDSWLLGGELSKEPLGGVLLERRATYFDGFPFTFDVFLYDSTERAEPNKSQPSFRPITGVGLVRSQNIQASALWNDYLTYTIHWKVARVADLEESILSMHGDDDLVEELNNVVAGDYSLREVLNIDCKDEKVGYYLRWIDHFGCIRYYLFGKGSITEKTSDTENAIDAGMNEEYQNQIRTLAKTSQDTIKACAVHLDKATLAYIRDIVTSPEVDLYIGKNGKNEDIWQPVNVVSGSYTSQPEEKAIHQSYEVQFNLPKYEAQHR